MFLSINYTLTDRIIVHFILSKTDFEVIAYESRKKIRIKMIDKTQKITFAPKHGKWVFYFNCNSG